MVPSKLRILLEQGTYIVFITQRLTGEKTIKYQQRGVTDPFLGPRSHIQFRSSNRI